MTRKKMTIIVSIVVIVLFVVAIAAVSYAFYNIKATGQGIGNQVKGTTAKISTKFEDEGVITIENMIPGEHFSKTFSLESFGNSITYKIVVNELVNEFTNYEDITYVLEEDGIVIKEGVFPNVIANNEISDTRTISNGEKKNYTITITYQNTEEDQTPDMGKTISGKLFIKEI